MKCHKCNGTGVVGGTGDTCWKCEGSGEVEVEQREYCLLVKEDSSPLDATVEPTEIARGSYSEVVKQLHKYPGSWIEILVEE